MSILLDKNTKVIVQGMTGREGSLRTEFMKKYGTKVVAGVTPGPPFISVRPAMPVDTLTMRP